MTKIEEVARAILKARYYDCEPEMYGSSLEGFFAAIDPEHMDEARIEARAAIEAMKKPTQAMHMAAWLAADRMNKVREPNESWPEFNGMVFDAMISAALSEKE